MQNAAHCGTVTRRLIWLRISGNQSFLTPLEGWPKYPDSAPLPNVTKPRRVKLPIGGSPFPANCGRMAARNHVIRDRSSARNGLEPRRGESQRQPRVSGEIGPESRRGRGEVESRDVPRRRLRDGRRCSKWLPELAIEREKAAIRRWRPFV